MFLRQASIEPYAPMASRKVVIRNQAVWAHWNSSLSATHCRSRLNMTIAHGPHRQRNSGGRARVNWGRGRVARDHR